MQGIWYHIMILWQLLFFLPCAKRQPASASASHVSSLNSSTPLRTPSPLRRRQLARLNRHPASPCTTSERQADLCANTDWLDCLDAAITFFTFLTHFSRGASDLSSIYRPLTNQQHAKKWRHQLSSLSYSPTHRQTFQVPSHEQYASIMVTMECTRASRFPSPPVGYYFALLCCPPCSTFCDLRRRSGLNVPSWFALHGMNTTSRNDATWTIYFAAHIHTVPCALSVSVSPDCFLLRAAYWSSGLGSRS